MRLYQVIAKIGRFLNNMKIENINLLELHLETKTELLLVRIQFINSLP